VKARDTRKGGRTTQDTSAGRLPPQRGGDPPTIQLPVDPSDPFDLNVRSVPMPIGIGQALLDWATELEKFFEQGTVAASPRRCPACEYAPHPSVERLLELRSMPYEDYLDTDEWRAARKAKLRQVNHQCRRCGRDRYLHVHHLTYDHLGHEWLDELVVLCQPCHWDVHDERDEQRRQYRRRRR
jgi:hypothetical protein